MNTPEEEEAVRLALEQSHQGPLPKWNPPDVEPVRVDTILGIPSHRLKWLVDLMEFGARESRPAAPSFPWWFRLGLRLGFFRLKKKP